MGFGSLTDAGFIDGTSIGGGVRGVEYAWGGISGEGVPAGAVGRIAASRDEGQVSYVVNYKGQVVGEYFADIIVEDVLVLELKCVERLGSEQMAQCLNYLRVSGLKLCLLVNFQRPKVEVRRVVPGFEIAAD